MKTGSILILLIYLLLCRCSSSSEPITEQEQIVEFGEERIIYKYKGVSVTRVVEGTESRFYYGNYKDTTHLPGSYVKSTFHGFNSGIDAYLLFKPHHVEVYYSMGNFDIIGDSGNIRVIDHPGSNNFTDDIKGNYDNACRISDGLEHEQELNATNHSKVKVIYQVE